MQVFVEAMNGLEKRMTVEVPPEKIELEIKKRLKSMQPTVKLQGFRPGKVPMSVLEKRFSGSIRREVAGEVVNSSFFEAVGNQDLKPAGLPKIESQSHDKDKGLRYTAVFEVYPEFQIVPMNEIKIDRVVSEVLTDDVDAMIERLRQKRCSWNAVERVAKVGDRLTIDYKATIDGESFDEGEADNVELILGSKTMITGFEDGLIGASVGENNELDLTFPENYRDSVIAGKVAKFSVTTKIIEEAELPEIDDAFIKAFGVEEGGIDVFRRELESSMRRELEKNLKAKRKAAVMDALLLANEFEIPNSMVEAESQRIAEQMNKQLKMSKGAKAPNELKTFKGADFKEQGQRRVALGLIMSEIIQENNLVAPADHVRAEVESIAASYHDPKEVASWYYQDETRLQEVESVVIEDQVVTWVLEHAQVTDNVVTFDQVIGDSQ